MSTACGEISSLWRCRGPQDGPWETKHARRPHVCWSPWRACSQSSLSSWPHPVGSEPCPGAGVCRSLVAPSACSAPPSGLWWRYSSPPSQTPALHAGPAGWPAPRSTGGWWPPPDAAVPPALSSASDSGLQRRSNLELNRGSSHRDPWPKPRQPPPKYRPETWLCESAASRSCKDQRLTSLWPVEVVKMF